MTEMSRRDFLRLAGCATAGGILWAAGCRPEPKTNEEQAENAATAVTTQEIITPTPVDRVPLSELPALPEGIYNDTSEFPSGETIMNELKNEEATTTLLFIDPSEQRRGDAELVFQYKGTEDGAITRKYAIGGSNNGLDARLEYLKHVTSEKSEDIPDFIAELETYFQQDIIQDRPTFDRPEARVVIIAHQKGSKRQIGLAYYNLDDHNFDRSTGEDDFYKQIVDGAITLSPEDDKFEQEVLNPIVNTLNYTLSYELAPAYESPEGVVRNAELPYTTEEIIDGLEKGIYSSINILSERTNEQITITYDNGIEPSDSNKYHITVQEKDENEELLPEWAVELKNRNLIINWDFNILEVRDNDGNLTLEAIKQASTEEPSNQCLEQDHCTRQEIDDLLIDDLFQLKWDWNQNFDAYRVYETHT